MAPEGAVQARERFLLSIYTPKTQNRKEARRLFNSTGIHHLQPLLKRIHSMTPAKTTGHSQPAKKKRKRLSKLDPFYYTVASLLFENARLRLEHQPARSLQDCALRIEKKHGVSINQSDLSRYINKHPMLKIL